MNSNHHTQMAPAISSGGEETARAASMRGLHNFPWVTSSLIGCRHFVTVRLLIVGEY